MKIHIFSTWFFLAMFSLVNLGIAQSDAGENQQSFEVWFGLENRITPIYPNSELGIVDDNPGIPVNIDKQLSGTSISIGIAYLLPHIKTWLSFEYAARYDHLYYQDLTNSQFSESVNGIINDYHFRLTKPIKTGKISLLPGIGYSFMNRGTEYRQDYNGSWNEKTLNFDCFDVSFGVGYKQFAVDFRTYLISENNYDKETGFILLPEIKLMYKIPVF